MRPVSDALLTTVRGSHQMAARARVVTSFQIGTDPDGTEIPIIGGDVEFDASADIRSTLDLATDPTLWPKRRSDLLAPYGNEVFVERGVKLGGGSIEWVSLGYFRVDTSGQQNAPTGAVRLGGKDRMAGIVDGRLVVPAQFSSSTSYGSVVAALVLDIYPDAMIEWDDLTELRPIGRTVLAEEDRFAFLDELIKAVGKIWFFDHRGVLVIKDQPSPASPVFDVTAGAGGVVVELDRELSREGVYNGVVASGEAADTQAPARAVVVDSNSNSPTFWGGPFGKVPRFFSSPLLTTGPQCASAAASLLRTSIGLPYNVDFTAVPNPGLEPLDPVRVTDPGIGPRVHVLEKLTMPLLADAAMRSTTREQTHVVLLEV